MPAGSLLPVLMRPVVPFVTRSPVAPNNPMPSPLPQIEALIEEHQLLKRIYRQRSGDDETAAIGELGEVIAAVEIFADIPVLMARRWPGGFPWRVRVRRSRSGLPVFSCAPSAAIRWMSTCIPASICGAICYGPTGSASRTS
jgi:hypothetical protein